MIYAAEHEEYLVPIFARRTLEKLNKSFYIQPTILFFPRYIHNFFCSAFFSTKFIKKG